MIITWKFSIRLYRYVHNLYDIMCTYVILLVLGIQCLGVYGDSLGNDLPSTGGQLRDIAPILGPGDSLTVDTNQFNIGYCMITVNNIPYYHIWPDVTVSPGLSISTCRSATPNGAAAYNWNASPSTGILCTSCCWITTTPPTTGNIPGCDTQARQNLCAAMGVNAINALNSGVVTVSNNVGVCTILGIEYSLINSGSVSSSVNAFCPGASSYTTIASNLNCN